jgi:hypothetical protein
MHSYIQAVLHTGAVHWSRAGTREAICQLCYHQRNAAGHSIPCLLTSCSARLCMILACRTRKLSYRSSLMRLFIRKLEYYMLQVRSVIRQQCTKLAIAMYRMLLITAAEVYVTVCFQLDHFAWGHNAWLKMLISNFSRVQICLHKTMFLASFFLSAAAGSVDALE